MSDDREPARDAYDAIIDIAGDAQRGQHAYALVKKTYSFGLTTKDTEPAKARPLAMDMRDPELEPRMPSDTDFWPFRSGTDVLVYGSAFAPGGAPIADMVVGVGVGRATKQARVFGPRMLDRSAAGKISVSAEPFVEVPLTWANAYGGVDFDINDERFESLAHDILTHWDHPGMYPRNPHGTGYMVKDQAVEGMPLPQVEDPRSVLTAANLLVGDPRNWWKQPLPCGFGAMHIMAFPRFTLFAPEIDAWYPGPDDETLPEVQRGFLEPNYRSLALAQSDDTEAIDPRVSQEGSHGMTFYEDIARAPVRINGMHPEYKDLQFNVPDGPALEIAVDGKRTSVRPRLYKLTVHPTEQEFTVLYGASLKMPRALIPGIHKHIPLELHVDGDSPVPFETPPTLKDMTAEAQKNPRPPPVGHE